MNISTPVSPKLPTRRAKSEFYRYYAGYPIGFAEWALKEFELPSGALILDPWNGSGTTAAACAQIGLSCQGFDLNPVMVHLGRARVACRLAFEEAEDLIHTVDANLRIGKLLDIRTLGSAFRERPVTKAASHSVAIAALFPYARSLLRANRTKNPSWFKKGATFDGVFIDRYEFFLQWRFFLHEFLRWRGVEGSAKSGSISIDRADSRKSLGEGEKFDGVLTSPPYLTRLDYVQATLPELLLLKEFDETPDLDCLRRSMLGSPLTSKSPLHDLERLPSEIRNLLRAIEDHSSKASSSYYLRFFSSYFVDLLTSLRNISNVMKPGAVGCLVVQSSSYKEIEIDLARLSISLGKEVGFSSFSMVQFDARRSISLLNTRAHSEARKPKTETAVFFRRS